MSSQELPAPPPEISAFAPTRPAGPLSTARSGGLRALLADPAIHARLAAKGLTTAAAIAALEAQFPWLRAGPPRRLQPSHGPSLRRSGPSSSAPQFPVVDSDR